MKILMKNADLSNECRPVNVSEHWLDCLIAEFFNQVKNSLKNFFIFFFYNYINEILKNLRVITKN